MHVGAVGWGSERRYKSLGCLENHGSLLSLGFWVAKQVNKAGVQPTRNMIGDSHWKWGTGWVLSHRTWSKERRDQSKGPNRSHSSVWNEGTEETMKELTELMIRYGWWGRERVKGTNILSSSAKCMVAPCRLCRLSKAGTILSRIHSLFKFRLAFAARDILYGLWKAEVKQ